MAEKKRIIWEKWENPAVFTLKDFKQMSTFLFGDTYRDNNGNMQVLNNDHIEDDDDENEPKMTVLHGSPIPFNPKTDIGKSFHIWIGHTNFNLNPKITNILNKFPGVEILRLLTRYRFLIGFGKAFLTQEDDPLNKNPDSVFDPTRKIREEISTFFENIGDVDIKESSSTSIPVRPKYWIEYTLPNGKKKLVTSEENTEEFQRWMEVLKEAQQIVGGSISSSTG